MTKKQILLALVTFIAGFGGTFFIIRTYFPKQKVEKKVEISHTSTNTSK